MPSVKHVESSGGHRSFFTTNTMALGALALGLLVPTGLALFSQWAQTKVSSAVRDLPEKAQIINQKSFSALDTVLPPTEANATTVCFSLLS